MLTVPVRYIPKSLSKKDRQRQQKMLRKSRKLYKQHSYYTRKKLPSYKHTTSKHILNARQIYKVDSILPSNVLAKATGCSVAALKRIVNKGAGAYFSSGSRPNQTAQSWGVARLASAITGGKAAAVDYNIIADGCDHHKKAFRLATRAKQKYGHGSRRVPQAPL